MKKHNAKLTPLVTLVTPLVALVASGNVARLFENSSNTIPDTMETLVAANDAEGSYCHVA